MARGKKEPIDVGDTETESGLLSVIDAYARARGEAIDIAVLAGGEYYFLLVGNEASCYRCYFSGTGLTIEQVQQVSGQRMAAILIECAADYLRKGMALQRCAQADRDAEAIAAAMSPPEVPHE